MKKISFLLLAIVFVCSCDLLSDPEPKPKPDSQGLLLDARSYTYSELPDPVRNKAADGYTFARPGEQTKELKKEDGYYVRLILNNLKLANASTQDTNWRQLLDNNNFYALYGKYRNNPSFLNTRGNEIDAMDKKGLYNIFYISRNDYIDTTFYGPLFERPVNMIMNCYYLDSINQPRMAVR